MIDKIKIFFVLSLVFVSSLFFSFEIKSQTCSSLEECNKLINEYQGQVTKLQSQANTLSNQIAQFDAQIRLTLLKIAQTEEKIGQLSGRIDQLKGSVDALTNAYNNRVVETYKLARLGDPAVMIMTASDLNEAFQRYSYLKKIQEADKDLLSRLQAAQNNYEIEKVDQEDLQKQLNEQKKNLDSQKAARANLLAVTRNDERRYQQLLAAAKAEYEAIVAIVAGKGVETEIGKVNEGQRIANIIQGPSCNSSGSHLHFIVRKQDNTTDNPFNYLKSADHVNCSGSSCGSGNGDAFNPSGSWNWPISAPITFKQGYGSTWAVRNTWVSSIYKFHNGIDINSSSSEVRAVQSGTLYRGSYNVGCQLRYVRVDHDNSELDTIYLHINY